MKSTIINCSLWDSEKDCPLSTPCEAWLLNQDDLPDFKFYITKNPVTGGYTLTEFQTGFSISGHYPEPSKPKAAAWLKTRLELNGKDKMIAIILDQQNKHPKIN